MAEAKNLHRASSGDSGLARVVLEVSSGMGLFVYIVTYDTGFAPNPFHGYCTLATCKPLIRRGAQRGDWVVGLGAKSRSQEGKLIYAMQVEEAMSYDEYWNDPRFEKKKPERSGRRESECGDNIYHTDEATGEWIQERGYHSKKNGCPDPAKIKHDTAVPRVLISQKFVYRGLNAIDIPEGIKNYDRPERFIGIRGHRRNFPSALEGLIVEWLQKQTQRPGVHGKPTHFDPKHCGSDPCGPTSTHGASSGKRTC